MFNPAESPAPAATATLPTAPASTDVVPHAPRSSDVIGTVHVVAGELVLRIRSALTTTKPVCACGDPGCLDETRRIIAMVHRAPIRAFLFHGWRA
jgi:hypothetical protein